MMPNTWTVFGMIPRIRTGPVSEQGSSATGQGNEVSVNDCGTSPPAIHGLPRGTGR